MHAKKSNALSPRTCVALTSTVFLSWNFILADSTFYISFYPRIVTNLFKIIHPIELPTTRNPKLLSKPSIMAPTQPQSAVVADHNGQPTQSERSMSAFQPMAAEPMSMWLFFSYSSPSPFPLPPSQSRPAHPPHAAN